MDEEESAVADQRSAQAAPGLVIREGHRIESGKFVRKRRR